MHPLLRAFNNSWDPHAIGCLRVSFWRQSPRGNLCHVFAFREVGLVLTLAEAVLWMREEGDPCARLTERPLCLCAPSTFSKAQCLQTWPFLPMNRHSDWFWYTGSALPRVGWNVHWSSPFMTDTGRSVTVDRHLVLWDLEWCLARREWQGLCLPSVVSLALLS